MIFLKDFFAVQLWGANGRQKSLPMKTEFNPNYFALKMRDKSMKKTLAAR